MPASPRPAPAADPLPCPFCGEAAVGVVEGSTFRWRHAECGACLARGPEVRIDLDVPPEEREAADRARALAAWNERAPAS